MLYRILLLIALLFGGKYFVSYVRSLIDEYSYNYKDVDKFIDRYQR